MTQAHEAFSMTNRLGCARAIVSAYHTQRTPRSTSASDCRRLHPGSPRPASALRHSARISAVESRTGRHRPPPSTPWPRSACPVGPIGAQHAHPLRRRLAATGPESRIDCDTPGDAELPHVSVGDAQQSWPRARDAGPKTGDLRPSGVDSRDRQSAVAPVRDGSGHHFSAHVTTRADGTTIHGWWPRMVTVVLVHGVGGPSPEARWLEPLNRRLAELGFPSLSEPDHTIRTPDYSRLFDTQVRVGPADTYVKPDERDLAYQKRDYALRQKELERRVRPVAESSDVFGFNMVPGAVGNPLADAVEFFAFNRVREFMERPSVRPAIWSRVLKELPAEGSVIIIAHSLGSVVVAGLLRKLPPGVSVELLVTIGSPLYFDRYRSHLSSLNANFPYSQVRRWVNVFSPWDGVTGGRGIARKLPQALDVCAHINGDHDLSAYMSHPSVAMAVGCALFGEPHSTERSGVGVSRRIHESWFELLLGTTYSGQISRLMDSDQWRKRMRLDGAREEVARRAVADIEIQRSNRSEMLRKAMELGVRISTQDADDHPCAEGRFPTYSDLVSGTSAHLRSRWSDEELVTFGVALMVQPIAAPFDIPVGLDARCNALELTLDRVRRDGSDLADRTFAEQLKNSLQWGKGKMSDNNFPWGRVLIGTGLLLLAATGVGIAAAAPVGLAGAAVVTSTLAAFGPGGMVGGLLTLGTLTGTAASMTTLGVATELEDEDGISAAHRAAAVAGTGLAAASPQALTVSLASILAVVHAQTRLHFESTASTVRTVLENALDTTVAEHTLHSELAPDGEGTKSWKAKVDLIEKALRGLDELSSATVSEQAIMDARRSIEDGEPPARSTPRTSRRSIESH